MEYIPKGSMCNSCINMFSNCSHLNFKNMQIMKKIDESTIVVKCDNYTYFSNITVKKDK